MQIVQNWALPDSDRYFADFIRKEGGFQLERLRAALDLLPLSRRRVALDVGAHVGIWAKDMLHWGGFEFVHAFEPAADTWECLQYNLESDAICGKVTLHYAAVADKHGLAMVRDDATRPGNTGSRFIELGASRQGTTVPVVTLDGLVEAGFFRRIDFLKIDVEGAETLVLRGGCNIIRECKPMVYLEQKRHFGQRFGVQDGSAGKLLEEWGARLVAQFKSDFVYTWMEEDDGIEKTSIVGGK